ncbi:MAG: uroporphyrinogen-III C-methyltransferase [Rhodanobacter sp.]
MSTADTPKPAPDGAPRQPPPAPTMAEHRAGKDQLPPRRSGGALALALLLALLAILGAGYVGWRQWQLAQGSAAGSAGLAALQQRVITLETSLRASDSERASLKQQLDQLAQQNQGWGAQVPALEERTRHLEDAVATLAQRTQSGREPVLLDETESLLRMAAERYRLFHDAEGAEHAYELADQTLAAVDDGAFSPVRQTIRDERDALARSHPADQAHALQQLQNLRGSVATLPLKPADRLSATTNDGVWARIARAFGSLVHVQRDNGGPMALQDARFARELAVLDLAQAQAALLAHDGNAFADAVHRADAGLLEQFDVTAPDVQQAHALLQQLETVAPAGTPLQLGAALIELRNLRAVHALRPAPASSSAQGMIPAHTESAGRAHKVAPGGSRS